MTPRMRDALDYISAHIRQHGSSPSYRQIGEALGIIAKSGVHRLVSELEEAGRIRRDPGKPRSIEIIGDRLLTAQPTTDLVAELRRRGVGPEVFA